MGNMDIEEYIKDLSPELKEKARSCTNVEELLKLARENKVPIPDDALEAVAGGKDKGDGQQVRNGKNKQGQPPVDFPCWCLIKDPITENYERYPFAKVCNLVYVARQGDYTYAYENTYYAGSGILIEDLGKLVFYAYVI